MLLHLIFVYSLAIFYPIYSLSWRQVNFNKSVHLYVGDVPNREQYKHCIGLSLSRDDRQHIRHDIRFPMPIPDNCVDIYQSEDVFEHIEYNKLVGIINEIYRILRPGGFLRISLPDYRCNVLYNRAVKDLNGNIVFDPGGEGKYYNGKVINGGHVWFPVIENVVKVLEQTLFAKYGIIDYLHFYDVDGNSITKSIDYSKGYIQRTPDHDLRVKCPYRVMSIVVDMYKKGI